MAKKSANKKKARLPEIRMDAEDQRRIAADPEVQARFLEGCVRFDNHTGRFILRRSSGGSFPVLFTPYSECKRVTVSYQQRDGSTKAVEHAYTGLSFADPSTEIPLEAKPRLTKDRETARRYIKWLGFDEAFRDSFLELYTDTTKGRGQAAETQTLDQWNFFLRSLSGKFLGPVLMPDASSARKWEKRLAGRSWSIVRVGKKAVDNITRVMLQQFSVQYSISKGSLRKGFNRRKGT